MIPRSPWTLALVVAQVLAHGGLNNYTVRDTWYRGYTPPSPHLPKLPPARMHLTLPATTTHSQSQISQPWLVQRPWDSIDPIFDHDSPHLACNRPGTAAAAYIPIDAGDEITAVYWYWTKLYIVGRRRAEWVRVEEQEEEKKKKGGYLEPLQLLRLDVLAGFPAIRKPNRHRPPAMYQDKPNLNLQYDASHPPFPAIQTRPVIPRFRLPSPPS